LGNAEYFTSCISDDHFWIDLPMVEKKKIYKNFWLIQKCSIKKTID